MNPNLLLSSLAIQCASIKPDLYGGTGLYCKRKDGCEISISFDDCISLKFIKTAMLNAAILVKEDGMTGKMYFYLYLLHAKLYPTIYTECLPTTFSTPIFTSQKLDLLNMQKTAKIASLKRIYEEHLEPIISLFDTASVLGFQDLLIADAQYHSRVIESPQGLIMVPVIDFCNHSFTPTAFVTFTNTHIVLRSSAATLGELTLNYGNKPNEEFLFIHGFVLANNPFNSVTILPPFISHQHEKLQILKDHGISPLIHLEILENGEILSKESEYIMLLAISSECDNITPHQFLEKLENDGLLSIMLLRGYTILQDAITYNLDAFAADAEPAVIEDYKSGQREVLDSCMLIAEDKCRVLLQDSRVIAYLSV